MYFEGQDNDGRLILNLEGEHIYITKTIPADDPIVLGSGGYFHTIKGFKGFAFVYKENVNDISCEDVEIHPVKM